MKKVVVIAALIVAGAWAWTETATQPAPTTSENSTSLARIPAPALTSIKATEPVYPPVATVANESEWRADRPPVAWPSFTKLPDEKPLAPKSTKQKLEMARSVNARWESYASGISKTYPTSSESGSAIMYLLTIDPRAPEFPAAWAEFVPLREVDRKISQQAALDKGKAMLAKERVEAKKRGVSIGMTADQVLQSSWGKPQSVNVTITGRSRNEQWVYAGFQYLFFEDGVLTSIHTSR